MKLDKTQYIDSAFDFEKDIQWFKENTIDLSNDEIVEVCSRFLKGSTLGLLEGVKDILEEIDDIWPNCNPNIGKNLAETTAVCIRKRIIVNTKAHEILNKIKMKDYEQQMLEYLEEDKDYKLVLSKEFVEKYTK